MLGEYGSDDMSTGGEEEEEEEKEDREEDKEEHKHEEVCVYCLHYDLFNIFWNEN